MNYSENFFLEDINEEKWKDIPNFEGLYQISNFGRVKILTRLVKSGLKNKKECPFIKKSSIILKQVFDKKSYFVKLNSKNKHSSFPIKTLMLKVFLNVDVLKGFKVINIDGNIVNNSIENLKYVKNIRWREIVPLVRAGCNIKELSKIYGFSEEKLLSIKPRISERGIPKKYKSDNLEFFNIIDTEEKAYWLGFLAADGSVSDRSVQLCVSKTDISHIEKFRDCINKERQIREYVSKYSSIPLVYIRIANINFAKNLHKYGLVPRKTFKLYKLPDIREDLIHHYIRGYFDGDGCVHIRKEGNYRGFIFSILGNKPFLEEIEDILIKNCIITKVSINLCKPRKNQITCQYVKDGNPQVFRILNYLYKDSTIYLERKYAKFLILKSKSNKV